MSFGAFVAYRAGWSERVVVEIGLRWDRQSYAADEQISPRINALWRPNERTDVRLGAGRYFQSQRIHELRVEDGETTFSPAEASRHLELTVQHRLPRGWSLRFDAYDRSVTRVQPRWENLFDPLELFPESVADRVRIAPERARLRGIELMAQGSSEGPWAWWVGYSLSFADDVVDGRAVPRAWDQRHAGKFLAAYTRDGRWSISLSGTGHTGWPTTPMTATIATLPDGSTRIDPVVGERNSRRFPGYARLDLRASRWLALSRGRLRLDLEILNVTDRSNVCCVGEHLFVERPNGSVDVQRELDDWLGITPSAAVTWAF